MPLGGQIGSLLGAGVGTAIAPGIGTAVGASIGGASGSFFDTFQAEKAAKIQRTSGMFGGPRVRPPPKMAQPTIPSAGVPYLGAPAAVGPVAQADAGMMAPAPTQGG